MTENPDTGLWEKFDVDLDLNIDLYDTPEKREKLDLLLKWKSLMTLADLGVQLHNIERTLNAINNNYVDRDEYS